MIYTGNTSELWVIAVREDIFGFTQSQAWAGRGSIPFGLFSCPGWRKPLIRLSNVFSASARRAYSTGLKASIVNVRPHSEGSSCVVVLRFYPDDWADLDALGINERSRLYAITRRIIARCRSLCQICASPAADVLAGGVYCRSHAPRKFAGEVIFDKRVVRRMRRRWMNHAQATMTKYVWRGAGVSQPLYVVAGVYVIRIADALPGARQQVFEAFLDQGCFPVDMAGEWVFKLPKGERT
jgi:hypothetical protein